MSSNDEKSPQGDAGKEDTSRPTTPQCVSYQQLADGKNEIQIEYLGQVYRLRATKNGKLILNK